jgi:formate hydrogenlyase subunit 6/NADH:ubiquinone oxidoreductase subunit I
MKFMSDVTQTQAAPAKPAAPVKKKKKAKEIALVHYEGCTGCEVCIDVCPVPNCILTRPSPEQTMVNLVVEVVPEKCIGCNLCAKYCPWETIEMIPNPDLEGETQAAA